MATIIDFAAKRNERRVSAIVTAQEEAKQNAIISHYETAAHAYLKNDLETAVVEIQVAEQLKKDKPCPCAYCDPANEYRGSKFEGTKGLSNTEISKLMREDVKAAKKRGQLPKDLKVSIVTRHYTSIDIRITGFPQGVMPYNPAYLIATGNLAHPVEYGERVERYIPEVTAWIEVLKEIHAAYNRDNSDSMSDYFDVRYYGDVGVYWELESEIRKSL